MKSFSYIVNNSKRLQNIESIDWILSCQLVDLPNNTTF